MFIDSNDYIEVTVYYKKTGAHYVAYSKKDFEKKVIEEETKKKYSSVVVKMKTLTWGLYNNINEAAVIKSSNNDRDWNYKLPPVHKNYWPTVVRSLP